MVVAVFLVSREKEKLEHRVRLKVKAWLLLDSAWQNLRHWVSSGGRASPIISGKGDICQPWTSDIAIGDVSVILSEERRAFS